METRLLEPVYEYSAVFEKTCEATQKNVKSHVFLDFEKKNVKNVPVGLLNL